MGKYIMFHRGYKHFVGRVKYKVTAECGLRYYIGKGKIPIIKSLLNKKYRIGVIKTPN